jgi:hypothetical protein
MNAKHLLSAAGLLAVWILGANPVLAQPQVTRPAGWPDARTILQQFSAGENGVEITAAISSCPSENPYGDTVWVALLGQELTPDRSVKLASLWASPLRRCNDPRIRNWYRARLRASRGFLDAVPYMFGLLELRTREDVEFLKQIAFDETRNDELRSEILYRIGSRGTWEERLELYLDAYSRSRRIPDPYAYNAYHELSTSPVANRILERGLAAVEEQPRNPNAARILRFISSDSRSVRDAGWRARVRETLVRIEANRQGRFPQELVRAARNRRETLDASSSRPAQARP